MAEGKVLDCGDAVTHGIRTRHEIMPNGELRFRLRCSDGTAYIRTAASETSGWQKSHYHNSVQETYIVQEGRMALVEFREGNLRVRVLSEGEIVTTQPFVHHNVYMFPKAVIHTVKHGKEGEAADWISAPELDAQTRSLNEADILRLGAET